MLMNNFDNFTLQDFIDLMCSQDYKERFVGEYLQLKIRYEKLKSFNNKIEAYAMTQDAAPYEISGDHPGLKEPKHSCPSGLLVAQQNVMGDYLHLLELRAVIEGIDLSSKKISELVSHSNANDGVKLFNKGTDPFDPVLQIHLTQQVQDQNNEKIIESVEKAK